MIHLLTQQNRNAGSAKLVDGKLILSYPNAVRPILWQMDIEQTSSSAFEIDSGKKEGEYTLFLKKGAKAEEIACFQSREDASNALFSIGAVLEKSQGRVRRLLADDGGAPQSGSNSRMLTALVGIGLIVVLVIVMMNMSPRPPESIVAEARQQQQSEPSAGGIGEPVSADAFLRGM